MDVNRIAARVVKQATDETPQATDDIPTEKPAQINGRIGGQKGGPARAGKLSPERRSEIARAAARARWDRPSI
jgi:hypothetical protein